MTTPRYLRVSNALTLLRCRQWLVLLLGCLSILCAVAQPVLYFPFPMVASTNWISYSVPLVETAGWTVGSPGGPPATQAQFQAVLAALRAVDIEFVGTRPVVYFDNPSLQGLATSTFGGCTADGWSTSPPYLTINCVLGNPPPSIAVSGTTTVGGFEAPGKFAGNQAAAYGGNLTFDANTGMETYSVVTNGTVVLVQAPDATAAAPFTPFEWGYYNFGAGAVPVGMTNVAQISAGYQHMLVLRQDGTVTAWGLNSNGQTNVPAGLSNVVAVAAGGLHSLALRSDGTVVAWGANTSGQATVPAGLSNTVAIAAGYDHSLALRSNGTVIGWGNGFRGGVTNPVPGLSNAVLITAQSTYAIDAGTNFALRNDGSVVGWTASVAETSNIFSFLTNLPANWTNLTALAAGGRHLLALRADGVVLAWGANGSGQTNVPVGLSNVVAVAGGGGFSLALRADGTVVGWGDNAFNETNIPAGLSDVLAIAAGGSQCLALIGAVPPVQQALVVSPQWSAGSFSVSVPSINGRVYALEYKNSLSEAGWAALPLVAGTGAALVLNDPTATGNQRFYRVRRW